MKKAVWEYTKNQFKVDDHVNITYRVNWHKGRKPHKEFTTEIWYIGPDYIEVSGEKRISYKSLIKIEQA